MAPRKKRPAGSKAKKQVVPKPETLVGPKAKKPIGPKTKMPVAPRARKRARSATKKSIGLEKRKAALHAPERQLLDAAPGPVTLPHVVHAQAGGVLTWIIGEGDAVERDDTVDRISCAGQVQSFSSGVAGTVISVKASAGETVEFGQDLLEIA